MRGYIIRRLLLLIPTLFFFSTIVFIAVRFLPGDIVSIMLSKYRTAGFDRDQIARQLGVDVPMHVQYIRWMGGILLRADFGRSLDNQRPVTEKNIPAQHPDPGTRFCRLVGFPPLWVAHRYLFRLAAGHRRRLYHPQHLHPFHFHTRVLYRHPGDDLPCPLVWLGSLGDHDPLVRGSAGASGDDPGTRHGVGVADQRHDDADDAYHDAGGAPAGLHPHRLGQRFAGAGGGRAPCPQKRLDPGHHRRGHPNTLDGRRGGDHRDRFRPSRAGHVDDRLHLFPGLSRGVRHQHDSRHLPGAGEFSGGHRIRLARSQDTL